MIKAENIAGYLKWATGMCSPRLFWSSKFVKLAHCTQQDIGKCVIVDFIIYLGESPTGCAFLQGTLGQGHIACGSLECREPVKKFDRTVIKYGQII